MQPPAEEVLHAGVLEVHPSRFLALADGTAMRLTPIELRLLAQFIRNTGRVITRPELYRAVWGKPLGKDDRSVDVYVRKLRRKLRNEVPEWDFIHTHFAIGYRFDPERSQNFHTEVTGT